MADTERVRLFQQGKQVSQMISYMWRWADDEPQKKETQNARQLRKYFESIEEDSIKKSIVERFSAARELEFEISSLIVNQKNQVTNKPSEKLFGADPRAWLSNNPAQPVETAPEEVQLLIAIFGKERIEDEKEYISPLFNSTELRDYNFILNTDSFLGELKDPIPLTNEMIAFTFKIAYPPAPKFGEATVTKSQLESWINNKDNAQIVPSNIFIPVSTS